MYIKKIIFDRLSYSINVYYHNGMNKVKIISSVVMLRLFNVVKAAFRYTLLTHIYKNSVRTSQRTEFSFIIKTN
jgi:hypothetical protein